MFCTEHMSQCNQFQWVLWNANVSCNQPIAVLCSLLGICIFSTRPSAAPPPSCQVCLWTVQVGDCLAQSPACEMRCDMTCVPHRLGRLDSVPSAVLVAAQLLFDCPSEELQQEMLVPVVTAVLPWSLVHHQSIRWALAPEAVALRIMMCVCVGGGGITLVATFLFCSLFLPNWSFKGLTSGCRFRMRWLINRCTSLVCRAYSQLLCQAILEHFPSLLGSSCSPELRAVAHFFETCPSLQKLGNLRATVFREVLPGSARVPSRILREVKPCLGLQNGWREEVVIISHLTGNVFPSWRQFWIPLPSHWGHERIQL